MISAATIAIITTFVGGAGYEGYKLSHDENKADVYYQYDPAFYDLDVDNSVSDTCTSCRR